MNRPIRWSWLLAAGACLLLGSQNASAQRGALSKTIEEFNDRQRDIEAEALGENNRKKNNEIEGAIWEFKITPNKAASSKSAKAAAGDEPEAEAEAAAGEDEKAGDAPGGLPKRSTVPLGTALREAREASRSRTDDPIKADSNGIIRGRIRVKGNAVFEVIGSDSDPEEETRIGDVVMSKKAGSVECQIRFDESHEVVKGRAVFRMDKRATGGVYTGYYLDENKKRSKFELRRGED